MALDGITLTTIIAELRADLLPGKIDRILQPAATEIHLTGRTGPRHWRLLLSAHPVNSRLHLTKKNKPNPPQPPLFCMVLRKHLEGGRLLAIEQEPWERVVCFHIEASDELGGLTEKLLILEIMGKHANLILVDKTSGLIIDGIRRYTHAVSRHREVLPGRKYIAPPPQNKLPPDTVNEENLAQVIYQLPEKTLLATAIQKSLAGLSPETAREICFLAGLPADIATGNCGHYELSRVIVALRDLLAVINTRQYTPYVYWANGCPQAFAPWPLRHLTANNPGSEETVTPTINATLDAFFCHKNRRDKVTGLRNSLQHRMAAARNRIQRKKTGQEQDIATAREGLRYRQWGELLLTNLYRVNPRDNCCLAEDPANPGQIHHLELDPALSPTENVQRFFSKYNKARQTITQATKQLDVTCVELAYIESVLTALEQAEGWDDITEIWHELLQTEYLKKEKVGSRPAKTGKT
ncbi:MAG: NFACT family protein, partial [Heliobacteriaceae bacterium]|nr:NFACT family protein [Heliobacteriaceae bacterium]